jgi:4'-phosphopantetheinyl transferase
VSEPEVLADAAARILGVEVHAQRLRVGGCDVKLWTASLAELRGRASLLAALLSDAERARVSAMREAVAAERFAGGRAMLRTLLAAALSADPRALRLTFGAYGKPALDDVAHGGALRFNLAHSGEVVAVAICADADVGVDLERRRALRDLPRLVERALTPAERALYESWATDGAAPDEAFLRAWTVKEARLKSLGLSVGAALTRDHPVASALPWAAASVPQGPDYFAAVAVSSARS